MSRYKATFLAGIDSQFLSLSHSDPSMIVVTTVLSGAFVFHLATGAFLPANA